MEQTTQIGTLVKLKQDQKVLVEQLRLNGDKIAAAYSAFASAQERWSVDDVTGPGRIFLLYPKGTEREHPRYLLGQADLATHIRDAAAAKNALANTKAQLLYLGITD